MSEKRRLLYYILFAAAVLLTELQSQNGSVLFSF